MKRSEMLQIMLDAQFNPPERISNMHDGGQQMVQMVYHLLDVIEEAGMLPPSVGVGEQDEYGYLNYETEWEEE